ncbi:hypothetical protein EVA_20939, partial [gut metagenome]
TGSALHAAKDNLAAGIGLFTNGNDGYRSFSSL